MIRRWLKDKTTRHGAGMLAGVLTTVLCISVLHLPVPTAQAVGAAVAGMVQAEAEGE